MPVSLDGTLATDASVGAVGKAMRDQSHHAHNKNRAGASNIRVEN